jgi:predicted 2-oxoglutarate/Fe(II)-dependent dioxygenase YbiX/peroxiredoxin
MDVRAAAMSDGPGVGEPAPWFVAPSSSNPRYAFDSVAGRHIVLLFFASAAAPEVAQALGGFGACTDLFDDVTAAFFGVSGDPQDASAGRVEQRLPGYRYFWDFDRRVADLYGVRTAPALTAFVLSPALQVLARLVSDDPSALVARVEQLLRRHLQEEPPQHAPVLIAQRVFSPDLCRALIDRYESAGGRDSGFMRQVGGKTVGIIDYRHKRRSDHEIEDESVREAINQAIGRRLVPIIDRAFHFKATRIERYIVACYDAEVGGYFRPHRDNTTSGTAHRQFAVTINLNAEEYEGGDLRFPEFGRRTYRAPTGGAVVFSCSLLHEALPVTRGRRYACLPFLYDDASAAVRAANAESIVSATGSLPAG